MAKHAIDPIGRRISPEAQAARDSKLMSPADNRAGEKELAERASSYVSRFLTSCEQSRLELDDKLTVLYAMWNGKPISSFTATARSIHVPEPFKAVEAFVARVIDILIGTPKWFRVIGMDGEGKKNAAIHGDLIRTQLRLDNFRTKFTTFMRSCAIYGFAVGKVGWRLKKRHIKYNKVTEEVVEENGVPTAQKVMSKPAEEEVNLDGPTLEYVDPFDFYTDLRFPDVEDSPGILFRQERSEEYVLECGKRGLWKNVESLVNPEATPEKRITGPPGTRMNPATFQQMRDFTDGIQSIPTVNDSVSRIYEVYEFWGKFDPTTEPGGDYHGKEEEYVITIARRMSGKDHRSGWVCTRIARHPYWHGRRPSVAAHYTRRAHCFQSVGIIEPIAKLCSELDDRHNAGLEAAKLAVKPIIVADHSFEIYSNQMVVEPGSILRGPPAGIKDLFLPDRSDAALKWVEVIKRDIRETTGMISQLQGTGERAETATAHVSYIREANKRLAEVARNIAGHFLIPMLEMFHSMNQQMITTEKLVEILGEDGLVADIKKITPADVVGKVHFEVEAVAQIEMAGIEARMMTNFANTAAAFAQFDPGMVDWEALLRKIWTKNHGNSDVDEIFPRAKRPRKFRAPMEEHYMLSLGHKLMPQDGENLNAHMAAHAGFIKHPDFQKWNEDSKRRMYAHLENTKLAFDRFIAQELPQVPPGMAAPPIQPPGRGGPQAPPQGPPQGQGAGLTPQSQVRSGMASMAPRTPKEGEL